MEWDDLRFLLAVADGGSLDAAARALKVTRPVVSSHLSALETALNCELVLKTDDGVTITASGQRVVTVARAIATQIAELAKDVGGEQGEVAGRFCVSSTASFVNKAAKTFEQLREKYPALDIGLMVSSQVVDLRRKDADLAVRMFRDEQEGFALRKLGVIGWSLYASEKYLAGHTPGANLLDGHKVIAYDASFSNTAGGRWIAANATPESIAARVGGFTQALDAAAAHRGVCLVPCYLTNGHKVVRVTDQVLTTNDVYAVHLAERTDEPRLRVTIAALVDLFAREEALFAGT